MAVTGVLSSAWFSTGGFGFSFLLRFVQISVLTWPSLLQELA
jgi:hypothetical protein